MGTVCLSLAPAATAAAPTHHSTHHSTHTTDASARSPTAASRAQVRLSMPQTSESENRAAHVKKLTFAVGVLVWVSLDRAGQLRVLH